MRSIAPDPCSVPTAERLDGFLKCQRLALSGAEEIGGLIREGWSEDQAARLYDTFLRDHGVTTFFHRPFAWFGERTRFDGIGTYKQFQPSRRHILPGEVYILDSAPILNGYVADIGFTASLGPNPELEKAQAFLKTLRQEIPKEFRTGRSGGDIWSSIDDKIKAAGYDNIHKLYPFSVLGHRVHFNVRTGGDFGFLHFGWQSFWSLLSRGLFGQLLTQHHEGELTGLWAIEPHIGGTGFGAKFEEILVVKDGKAHWLEQTQ